MKTLFLLFSIVFLTSCPSDLEYEKTCEVNNPLEDLVWLKQIKTSFEQSASVTKKKIVQYQYNNETVFLIDVCFDCADNLISIYNCEGNIICEFGGIAGLNTCPSFDSEATNKIILWEN